MLRESFEQAIYYDDDSDEPRWKPLPKFTTPEEFESNCFYAAILKGHLYAVGDGITESGFARYNTQTNQWDKLAPVSVENTPVSMVELNGYIYIMSGVTHENPPEGIPVDASNEFVDRYNITTDTWETLCPLSVIGRGFNVTSVAHEGKILRASVEPNENYTHFFLIIQVYDPVSNTWYLAHRETIRTGYSLTLTVQRSTCYLVLHDGPHGRLNMRTHQVYKLSCDFESDPPSVGVEKKIRQTFAITKYEGAFGIDDDVFVNFEGCVYKPNPENVGDLGSLTLKNVAINSNCVYFTFDKRL